MRGGQMKEEFRDLSLTLKIPSEVELALNILENQGYRGYLVGGCVRDYLMEKEPHDFDITTDATPREIKKCFEKFLIIETGIKHGTLTVLIDNIPIEITTHRLESRYSDHRRPDQVIFTQDLVKDLGRRDFTMNAMAYHLEDRLIDVFGGKKDIEDKVIRCVGNPDKRFKEDALRILRGIRFSGTLGFDIEKNTKIGMFKNKEDLKIIASERIVQELNQFLCGKNVKPVLLSMIDILGVVLPGLLPMKGFEQNNPYHCYDVLEHTAVALENIPAKIHLRLAVLFHDVGKPDAYFCDEKGRGHFYGHSKISESLTRKSLKALKYDNDTIDKVVTLVKYHDMVIEPDKKFIKRWLNRLSEDSFRDLILIKKADTLGQEKKCWARLQSLGDIEKIVDEIILAEECFSRKDLRINGWDLMALGIPKGPEIKEALEFLLEAVINEEIENKKEVLLKKVKEYKNVNRQSCTS